MLFFGTRCRLFHRQATAPRIFHSAVAMRRFFTTRAMFLPSNIERFGNCAELYDETRPQPPAVICDMLAQLAAMAKPAFVVDMGSGSGLSTRLWNGCADCVVGVEPNDDMRKKAAAVSVPDCGTQIVYCHGYSHATGLPANCADIVTCSQSLHWMEPESTLAEVARVLRSGGVFAAYDCDWPPLVHPEADEAFRAFVGQEQQFAVTHPELYAGVHSWPKSEHLVRIKESGHFRYVREVLVHHVETGNAERFVGLALSQGGIATLLRSGLSEDELGVEDLRSIVRRTIGDQPVPWYWSYRIRLAML